MNENSAHDMDLFKLIDKTIIDLTPDSKYAFVTVTSTESKEFTFLTNENFLSRLISKLFLVQSKLREGTAEKDRDLFSVILEARNGSIQVDKFLGVCLAFENEDGVRILLPLQKELASQIVESAEKIRDHFDPRMTTVAAKQ